MKKIDETMLVSDVLEEHPEAEDIFIAHGLNCLGCPASARESLKEAADGHSIDLSKLIEDLNKILV